MAGLFFTYTAADFRARLTSPTPGGTLISEVATFEWDAGTDATEYCLWFGSTPEAYDLGDPAVYIPNTSCEFSNLPVTGGTVYVRLWTRFGEAEWRYVDYTYTAANLTAQLTSPANGSTFEDAAPSFAWNAIAGSSAYVLYFGSKPGALDLLYTGGLTGTSYETEAPLPVDGRTIYVRLYTLTDTWRYQDYTFTTADFRAKITSPAPGSTLTSGYPTFEWSAGTGVTEYTLYFGTAPGGYELGAHVVTGSSYGKTLPTLGAPVYVRFWSTINGSLFFEDHSYTAATIFAGTGALTAAQATVAVEGACTSPLKTGTIEVTAAAATVAVHLK